jgi:hypothetical protein
MRTVLSCLGLAFGAAALTATTGGVGPIAAGTVGAIAGGVAGGLGNKIWEALDRRVAERFFDGWHGIDENHHIARALRLAQIHALRAVLQRFDESKSGNPDPTRKAEADRFSRSLKDFLDAETRVAQDNVFGWGGDLTPDETAIRNAALNALPAAFDTGLAARRDTGELPALKESRDKLKAAVEASVLQEIRIRTFTIDDGPPSLFVAAFRGDERNDGWFDLFVRDAADDLKDGGEFEKAWNAEQTALIKAIEIAHTEILARIDVRTATIVADTSAIRAGQEQTQAAIATLSAQVARLVEASRPVARAAEVEGVREQAIIALAQRIAEQVEDFDQAMRELERAVEIAIEVQHEGRNGTNLGDFVHHVLQRLAALSADGRYDEAALAADDAFTAWQAEEARLQRAEAERRLAEAERQRAAKQQGIVILRAGLNQDLLRRNAASAARRIADIIDLETPDPAARFGALRAAQDEWYVRGYDKGLNLDLEVAIEVARIAFSRANDRDERGQAQDDLGHALQRLGERERGRARLEQAVAAFRAALEEWTRERVPLKWAGTQNNLGVALQTLGERESGPRRLEEAVVAYRAALEERTRERLPHDWAMTQINLGNSLQALGERESNMARLGESVAAYRAALEKYTREVPLVWAAAQNNLGNALALIGQRESGTAQLEEAVAAYRAALEEWTRQRVPLRWAMTQNNLGAALRVLGERESNTARLGESVAAYRAALEERTRERVPLDWATTQHNLGAALFVLGACESGTARLQEAIAAYRVALEERSRELPLDWAASFGNQGVALMLFADRANDSAAAETAVRQIDAALETALSGGHEQWAAFFKERLPKAQAIRDRLKGK